MLWVNVQRLSITAGLTVTAVLERTFFSVQEQPYIVQVLCCTYSLCQCVAVVGCLCGIWLYLNVSYIFFINVGLPMFCPVVSL